MMHKKLNDILALVEKLEQNNNAENLAALKKKIKQTIDENTPDTKHLIVKHYVSDMFPTVKGLGTEVHIVGDREDAEEFAQAVNAAIQSGGH